MQDTLIAADVRDALSKHLHTKGSAALRLVTGMLCSPQGPGTKQALADVLFDLLPPVLSASKGQLDQTLPWPLLRLVLDCEQDAESRDTAAQLLALLKAQAAHITSMYNAALADTGRVWTAGLSQAAGKHVLAFIAPQCKKSGALR